MKLIPLRQTSLGLKTLDIIQAVMQQPSPGQGIDVATLRARCRVLDAVEVQASGDKLHLEDADYDTLKNAVLRFQFGLASKDLLGIVDDIVEATNPPPQGE